MGRIRLNDKTMPQGQGYTLEQLKAMGAVPKVSAPVSPSPVEKRGYTLQELQAMGAVPKGSAQPQPVQTAPTALQEPKRPLLERVEGAVGGFAEGALKGVASTFTGASALGEKMLQAPLRAFGVQTQKPLGEQIRESGALTPEGTAQKVGFGAEQLAEMFVPVLPKTGTLAKIAGEAVEMGGKTALQRGKLDAEAAKSAAIGGGFAAGGKVLEKLGGKAAGSLKASAERGMTRALGPTTREMKAKAAKVVPGLIERKTVAMTRKGLTEQAEVALGKAGESLDEVLSKIPKETRVSAKPVLKALRDAKAQFMVDGVAVEPGAVKAIDDVIDTVRDLGPKVSFESMRSLRQILDKSVAKSKGFLMDEAGTFSVMAKREASNAIRRELASKFPDLAKVNAEYSFWKNVDDVLSATAQRTAGQSKPLGEQIFGAAGIAGGMATGGLSGAVGGAVLMSNLRKAMTSTGWNTVGALVKNKIADAIASGKFEAASGFLARVIEKATRRKE